MLGRSNWSKDIFVGDQFPSFTKLLNDDRMMKAAFHAGLFGLVVVAGKGDDKNTSKGVESLYRTSSVPDGLLRTGARLAQAIDLLSAEIQPIRDFFRPLWAAGWDLSAAGASVQKIDDEVAQAILSEGLVRDYLLHPSMRAHIKPFADAMHDIVKETDTWRKGREILAGLPIDQINSFALIRHPALRDYATMALMALKMTRNEIAVQLVDEEHTSKQGGYSYSGPTAWTMTALQTVLFREFFGSIDPIEEPKTLKLLTQLLGDFKFSDYYLSQQYEFLKFNYMWARKGHEGMKDVESLLSQQLGLERHLASSEILDRLPAPDDSTRAYLHAPPTYFVRYCNIVDDGSGDTAILHMTNSIATSHVAKAAHLRLSVRDLLGRERPSSDFVTWCVSTDGHLRSSFTSHAIPFIPRDLGISDEAFAEASRTLEDRTMRQVRQLGTVWERFPGVYCAPLNFHSGLLVVESGPQVTFHVSSADKEVLRTALARTTRDLPPDRYVIKEQDGPVAFAVSITHTPAAATTTPPPEPPQPKRREAEVSRGFVSSYCPQFRDLVRILGPFGVTVESGKGSHQKLTREGHMTVVSKNQRDGTLLLNEAVVLQVLTRLRINEEDFVRRTRKEPPQA